LEIHKVWDYCVSSRLSGPVIISGLYRLQKSKRHRQETMDLILDYSFAGQPITWPGESLLETRLPTNRPKMIVNTRIWTENI
ncbi:hypothetical protein CHS0354_025177, partial [Potamilus streckersoni]